MRKAKRVDWTISNVWVFVLGTRARDRLLLKTDAPRHAAGQLRAFLSFQSRRRSPKARTSRYECVSMASDQRADRDSASYPHIDAGS